MIAKEFPEVNLFIAKDQEEYQTLPAHAGVNKETGLVEITTCFELDKEELKQVSETGQIWLKTLKHPNAYFQPIGMNLLKPENFK